MLGQEEAVLYLTLEAQVLGLLLHLASPSPPLFLFSPTRVSPLLSSPPPPIKI